MPTARRRLSGRKDASSGTRAMIALSCETSFYE